MASFTFNTVQHQQYLYFSIPLCKYPSSLNSSKFLRLSHFPIFSLPKHPLQLKFSPLLVARVTAQAGKTAEKYATASTDYERSMKTSSLITKKGKKTGFPSLRSRNRRTGEKSVKNLGSSVTVEKPRKKLTQNSRKDLFVRKKKEMVSTDDNGSVKISKTVGILMGNVKSEEQSSKGKGSKMNDEVPLRLQLDRCSKTGDVMCAIQSYDRAQREGIKLGQYHYTVILYLCSSAAMGVVHPAKSGSRSRILNPFDLSKEVSGEKSGKYNESCEINGNPEKTKVDSDSSIDNQEEDQKILVSEDLKKYALQRGFEIYEKMSLDNIPMNEATLTSVARMAMAMGNGDMAFDMIKQMKALGINPRLRSYGPALSSFCNNGDVDKAFTVEKHMLDHGVYPEEPEIQALLRVSLRAGKADKVYYLLHKLRTSVRQVSPSSADLIIEWFQTNAASRVGRMKIDRQKIKEAIENGGGGWHGLGWLGRGKWTVQSTCVGGDGLCKSCGEKLATIDLDPVETENFAESVATIVAKREKNSSFQKFQKWLEYYGPYEAVIDAANVGLFSQRKFAPAKVNLVVNGIRQKLPSKKWPLIVLHNKRITGRKMDEPVNKAFIEKWKNADAIYATPTGSNDDWYWLYAAIKFKCLLVTNDEMRDHIFQLLGNDFFPKWKERHQVRFSFSDAGPVFHMPPPCSVVIQESDKGHWHIPIIAQHNYETERKWLCITRAKSYVSMPKPAAQAEESPSLQQKTENTKSTSRAEVKNKSQPLSNGNHDETQHSPQKNYTNLKKILSAGVFSNNHTLLSEIEAAERLGGYTIDFQI